MPFTSHYDFTRLSYESEEEGSCVMETKPRLRITDKAGLVHAAQLTEIVKAAFVEGYSTGLRDGVAHAIGSDGTDPEKAWLASRALASLRKSH